MNNRGALELAVLWLEKAGESLASSRHLAQAREFIAWCENTVRTGDWQ